MPRAGHFFRLLLGSQQSNVPAIPIQKAQPAPGIAYKAQSILEDILMAFGTECDEVLIGTANTSQDNLFGDVDVSRVAFGNGIFLVTTSRGDILKNPCGTRVCLSMGWGDAGFWTWVCLWRVHR